MASAETQLAFLHEVGQLLQRSTDLDEILGPVLRLLAEQVGLQRAGLCVWNRRTGGITLVAAHGLTPAEVRRNRWAPGEGVIGQVVETGQPVATGPSEDDLASGRDAQFLAVPVRTEDGVLGALACYRPGPTSGIESDLRLLGIVASLLVPAARRAIHAAAAGDFEPEESETAGPSSLIGRSKPMRAVYEAVEQVAASPATVLVRGESGTGKELVASAVHAASDRAARAFVKVNIAALPDALIESELFGHERGAFTGAAARRRGRFEQADGGTLFLDEIGDLSGANQVKLLRVLQEGELQRVGGTETLQVDVRIVAATSRNLEAMVEAGTFRADLYYRLNVFPIHLPALRERRADVLLLADHFVEKYNRSHGRSVRRISSSAIDMLMAYHWPGDVRELENCIERAVLLAREGVVLGSHLPPSLQTGSASGTFTGSQGLQARLDALEREIVLDALKESRGNMAEAARVLGVSERVMGLRVKKYGVDWRAFRA
jgi:Nif-specific regulatory protein